MYKPTIHVLHLPHRIDRYDSMIQQSLEQDFKIHWFEGERSLSRKDTKRCINLGHRKIVQYAQDNKMDYIIAAEDDMRFFAPGALEYYITNMPDDFQLYCGVIYSGDVDSSHRIKNGMSGTHTLITYHKSIYDFILKEMPDDVHCDRYCGDFAWKYKYYVCNPMVVTQMGGFSDNIRKEMYYDVYLDGKNLFKGNDHHTV